MYLYFKGVVFKRFWLNPLMVYSVNERVGVYSSFRAPLAVYHILNLLSKVTWTQKSSIILLMCFTVPQPKSISKTLSFTLKIVFFELIFIGLYEGFYAFFLGSFISVSTSTAFIKIIVIVNRVDIEIFWCNVRANIAI